MAYVDAGTLLLPYRRSLGLNIAILSGELSGDLIGAGLAGELRRLAPDVHLWGLGSGAMRSEGVELLADSADWGAISITEALKKVPRLLTHVAPRLKKELRARRPDAVVLIDFGAFNVRVARYCKSLGLKVCYYFPPGSWSRTGTRGAELSLLTDVIAAPFPWAAERYAKMGSNAVYVGHPLLERVKPTMTRPEFAAQFGMDPTRPIIGLLPGSRRHEVIHLMPALLGAARLIYNKIPESQFIVGVAPTISAEMMQEYLRGHGELSDRWSHVWHEFVQEAEDRFIDPIERAASKLSGRRSPILVTEAGIQVSMEDMRSEMQARRRSEHIRARADQSLPPTVLAKGVTYEIMAHSDVLLSCSGTATLEAAVLGTPMVILYRGSKIMELEYRLRGIKKKIRFIGLPNILADREIAPELIQEDANPARIAAHACALLNDPAIRQHAKAGLAEVGAALGTAGASTRTAHLVLDLASHEANNKIDKHE